MARLLLIDDDRHLAFGIAAALEQSAHDTAVACGGKEGIALGLTEPFVDLIILDLAQPQLTGFRVLRLLREGGYHLPILLVSARAGEADKVRAFRQGADQYMTKPFGVMELLARVDSLLARNGSGRGIVPSPLQGLRNERYAFGSVMVEPDTREVLRGGEPVRLSPLEFDLLVALLRRQGAATTRAELLRDVWKYEPDVVSRTLDTHILHLREKLEDEPSTPRHILTVRKLGYRLHC